MIVACDICANCDSVTCDAAVATLYLRMVLSALVYNREVPAN